jgi:hypothetical protein
MLISASPERIGRLFRMLLLLKVKITNRFVKPLPDKHRLQDLEYLQSDL